MRRAGEDTKRDSAMTVTPDQLPQVRLIATGGTIASRPDPRTGAVGPAVDPAELIAAVPAVADYATVIGEPFAAVASWNMTPAMMFALAQRLDAVLADPQIAGAVVTHGTDTVEETSLLVDLVLQSDKPVCFAVAQRHAAAPGADGPANLTAAVRVAASPAARGRGAMVVANDEIHAAGSVVKTHTTNPATFASPGHGPAGVVTPTGVHFAAPASPRQPLVVEWIEERVALVKLVTGMDDRLLRWLVDDGIAGLVIEGSGAGNVPGTAVPGIKYALDRGRPVVLTSRCPAGALSPTYGTPGGGRTLRDLGVIAGGELTGPKARIALLVLLGLTQDHERIRRHFEGDRYPQ